MSHEDKAQVKLEEIIQENAANGYPGIDRSAEAIEARHQRMNSGGLPSGMGKSDSAFGRKLEEHVINGDLSDEQAKSVLLALYGLG